MPWFILRRDRNIWSSEGHEITRTNVTGTSNVLHVGKNASVKHVIVTSSGSAVGFTVIEGAMIPPEHLQIDNKHQLHPTDPYALGKFLCEQTARAFLAGGKLKVTVLRPVYVLYPELECGVVACAADPVNCKGPAAGRRQPAGESQSTDGT